MGKKSAKRGEVHSEEAVQSWCFGGKCVLDFVLRIDVSVQRHPAASDGDFINKNKQYTEEMRSNNGIMLKNVNKQFE